MKCQTCGHESSDNAKFCRNCGSQLGGSPTPNTASIPTTNRAAAPRPT